MVQAYETDTAQDQKDILTKDGGYSSGKACLGNR